MKNIRRETCRLCESPKLKDILSLGEQYINDFPSSPEEKGRNGKCPLDIVLCGECSLLQLRHTAPQELMYARHYWYKSGVNNTIKNDLAELARMCLEIGNLGPGDVFLDIGANDGTLLKNVKGKAIAVGCEPARNLHAELKTNADHVIGDFWSVEEYRKLDLPKAKAITAIGMFYDMEDPNQFIRDAASVMSDDGIFIAQLMCLKPMLDVNDVGNICHEHLEYYSYPSLVYLFEKNGLEIFRVEENAINGGSYRLYARHLKNGSVAWSENLGEKDYQAFKERIEKNKRDCVAYIEKAVAAGKKVYAYGASTKGNVIMQYYGLDHRLIAGAADKNAEKWGKFTLTDVPIVSEDEGREKADIFWILPFGFVDEFVRREAAWLKKGGEFIVSTPEFKVIRG